MASAEQGAPVSARPARHLLAGTRDQIRDVGRATWRRRTRITPPAPNRPSGPTATRAVDRPARPVSALVGAVLMTAVSVLSPWFLSAAAAPLSLRLSSAAAPPRSLPLSRAAPAPLPPAPEVF